jgi:hypothetical protein
MKKIVLSLIAIATMVSANEVITDEMGNIHNVGITTNYEHTATGNDIYLIGLNNRIDMKNCDLDVYVEGNIGYSPSTSNMGSAMFYNLGAGVITPSITIWNNKVSGLAGLELQNEFDSSTVGVNTNLAPRIGMVVNDRLTISYKTIEQDKNVNTLTIGYKF